MKLTLSFVVLSAVCGSVTAADFTSIAQRQDMQVTRMPFGSGTPAVAATSGNERATHVVDGLYHIPGYMPGFPTAATIWPREIPVACDAGITADAQPTCAGYEVLPAVGRGEYLFIRPVMNVVAPIPEPAPREQPAPAIHKKPLG